MRDGPKEEEAAEDRDKEEDDHANTDVPAAVTGTAAASLNVHGKSQDCDLS